MLARIVGTILGYLVLFTRDVLRTMNEVAPVEKQSPQFTITDRDEVVRLLRYLQKTDIQGEGK